MDGYNAGFQAAVDQGFRPLYYPFQYVETDLCGVLMRIAVEMGVKVQGPTSPYKCSEYVTARATPAYGEDWFRCRPKHTTPPQAPHNAQHETLATLTH